MKRSKEKELKRKRINIGNIAKILFVERNTVLHFDSFGIEHISKEILSEIKDKSITHSTFRINSDD